MPPRKSAANPTPRADDEPRKTGPKPFPRVHTITRDEIVVAFDGEYVRSYSLLARGWASTPYAPALNMRVRVVGKELHIEADGHSRLVIPLEG